MEISTDQRFLTCLQYLADKFHQPIQTVDERYYLRLPTHIDQFRLCDALVYQITTTMKDKYIRNKIKIQHQTLIKILVNYDKKTDIIIATALIKLTPRLLLDATYDFGISRLKTRWDEVIALVNANCAKLSQKTMLNDLLRFLILNMDHKTKEAHIMLVDQQATVCNAKLEPIKQQAADIIDTLIDVAPQQIFIHADPGLAGEIVERVANLFPNCVCIEYRAVIQ